MPSVAKKLVVVQSNEPAPQATPIESTRPEELRLLEALLFAAGQPLDEAMLARRLPNGVNVKAALAQLKDEYARAGSIWCASARNGRSVRPSTFLGC